MDSRADTFEKSKDALANATMLVHPMDGAPLALTVDTSIIAIGTMAATGILFHTPAWQAIRVNYVQRRAPGHPL